MLKDLLLEAAKISGITEISAEKRTYLLDFVNRAARELWNQYDLPGALREDEFCVDVSQYQVTLPWYVSSIRAVRHSDSNLDVKFTDMRPLYHKGYTIQDPITWRIKNYTPLERDLPQASTLKFTIAEAQTSQVVIGIGGSTNNAAAASEEVVLDIGQTTVTSVGQYDTFPPLNSLTKSIVTTADIIVATADGVRVAVIPNRLQAAKNTLVQITDQSPNPLSMTGSGNDCYSFLYKYSFIPLFYDHDVFLDLEFEQALYWKMKMLEAADKEKTDIAIAAESKVGDQITRLVSNVEQVTDKQMKVVRSRFSNAWFYDRYVRS